MRTDALLQGKLWNEKFCRIFQKLITLGKYLTSSYKGGNEKYVSRFPALSAELVNKGGWRSNLS